MSETRTKGPAARSRFPAIIFLAGLLALPVLGSSALAQTLAGPEYQVKAGFIFNFINFVRWPQSVVGSEDTPICFCFASDDPSARVLFALDGKIARGHPLKVSKYDQNSDLDHCNVFFFATNDRSFIRNTLDRLKGRSVLTIGEIEGFTHMGGIINFFTQDNRLRFQVNTAAAEKARLNLSSQILRSAEIVGEEH